MSYSIVLPSIIPSITERCLKSIDPTILPHIKLVDNTQVNQGVSKAWNIGVDHVIKNKLDYLVILSAGLTFHNGMVDFIYELENRHPALGLDTQFAWHCIAIHRKVFEELGKFDERFFAYYEDSDFIRRMWLKYGVLAGVLNAGVVSVPRLPRFGVDATCEYSHAYHHNVPVDFDKPKQRFIEKWGDIPRYESPEDLTLLAKEPLL